MKVYDNVDLESVEVSPLIKIYDAMSLDKGIHDYLWLPEQQRIYDMLKSVSWSKDPISKKKEIDNIMNKFWFKRLGSGTNRLVYECLYDTRCVMKIPFEESGLTDGANEFTIQQYLKPFVCKTFDVGFMGVASLHERVTPILYMEQFKKVSSMHFDLVYSLKENGFMLDDVGIRTFRNIGIRDGFGLVILDYPTVYRVRPGGLTCKICGGRIDYDVGFNRIACKTCSKVYTTQSLSEGNLQSYERIITRTYGGKATMAIRIINGNTNEVILKTEPVKESKTFEKKPQRARNPFTSKAKPMNVKVIFPEGTLVQKDPIDIKSRKNPGQKVYNTKQVPYKGETYKVNPEPEDIKEEPVKEEEVSTIPLPNGNVSVEELEKVEAEPVHDFDNAYVDESQDYYDYQPEKNSRRERRENNKKFKKNKYKNSSINKNDF